MADRESNRASHPWRKELGSKLAAIAHTADEGGFHSIWAMAHVFQLGVPDIIPEKDVNQLHTRYTNVYGQ